MSEIDAETLANRRFTLEQRLGSGSTGTVYAAYDEERGEKVALKVLTYRSASGLYRFKREFRTLVDVVHPHLVTFYELFADDEDEVFFTMELIEGTNVLEYVRSDSDPPLDEARLRHALAQLVSAVQALHEHDKIHCDLKPNNVLVTGDGRVVILDFGIARDLAPALTPQSLYLGLSGTVPYMAPEQAKGQPPGPPSDWYAVGVILFQALTGRLPFQGSLVDVLSAKVSSVAPSPSTLVPGLPADLKELCADLLEMEPEKRPSGAELLGRLGVLETPAGEEEDGLADWKVETPGLASIGRAEELAALRDAFATSRQGRAVAAYVHGESGLGKTDLAQDFLHGLVEELDAVILTGRCYERELVPYKALDGVIDSLSRYLNRLDEPIDLPAGVAALCRVFPVLQRLESFAEAVGPGEAANDRVGLRHRAFAALRRILADVASRRPLVLYIDDLHWADADSAVLLRELLRGPEAPPLLLLASFPSEEIAAKPFLRDLLHDAGTDTCREVRLAPLDERAAGELTRTLLGDASDIEPLVAAIVHEAEGSPFFVEQLVAYARATESNLSSSIALGELIDARIAKMPSGALEMLRALAVAGRPLEAAVAYEAAGLEGDERPLVASLKSARLVRSSFAADHLEIFHNRIRKALGRRLDAAQVRRLHGRLAEVILARGDDDPEALYEHLLRAGEALRAGEEAAKAAAKALRALAFDRAAHFYRQALELTEPGEAERRRLLEGWAEALAHSGRPRDAAGRYLELAHGASRLEALRYRQRAAEEYLSGGYFDEGLEVVREVGREVGLELPASSRAALTSILWNRLRLRLRGLRYEIRDAATIPEETLLRADASWIMAASLTHNWPLHGNTLQVRHLLIALDTGDPVRISRALNLEASYRAAGGESPQRTAPLRRAAFELARGAEDPNAEGQYNLNTGIAAYLAGRWREGAESCERAESSILRHSSGGFWGLLQAQRFGLSCRLYLGDLDVLIARIPELLAEARDRGNVLAWTELASRLSVTWLALDQPSQSRRSIDEALERRASEGFNVPHFNALVGRCQADLYEGDGEAAWRRIEEGWPLLRRSLLMRLRLIHAEALFVRGRAAIAAARVEPRRDRLRLAERCAARLGRLQAPYAPPLADLLRAGLAGVRGNVEASLVLLDQSARASEAQEMELYAAVARRRRGEIAAGDEGKKTVESAETWMREHGVTRPERMTATLAPGFGDGDQLPLDSRLRD